MSDIPSQIGSSDAYKRCYYCKLCVSTHCYGDIWLEHKDFRDEDIIYESQEGYKERYGKIRAEREKDKLRAQQEKEREIEKTELELADEHQEDEYIDDDLFLEELLGE